MPKLGEGIIEATITKWLKSEGDTISIDESIVEIATDKVDTEVPSPVQGVLLKKLFNEGDIVAVDKVIAVLEVAGELENQEAITAPIVEVQTIVEEVEPIVNEISTIKEVDVDANKFVSPLVRNMARVENIPIQELNKIVGSGSGGRITKEDLLEFLSKPKVSEVKSNIISQELPKVSANSEDTIVEMSRIRKLIADHMVSSVKTSPHVTSIIDVNMSKIVKKRDSEKSDFLKRDNEKLTYTHLIVEAVAKVLKEFPGINVSVSENKIIYRKNINIGIATVLPDGNLIVPVVKNADQKSLLGIVKSINDLANRARQSKLVPDEIQGGTFSITNLGSFDTLIGTPIINQPQVAILAIGTIKKQVVVVETENGDSIGIAPMMYMALTYDHRVVDGAMAGMFLKRIKELLETQLF